MSTNISVKRVCEYCKETFDAQTTTTRYCSKTCNSRGYKLIAKQKKIAESNLVTSQTMNKIKEPIKEKDFLSVKEASLLLNISTKTLYRLIDRNDLNAFKFSERNTLIRRKDIDYYFEINLHNVNRDKSHLAYEINPENSYTLQEVVDKYKISDSALYKIIQKFKIPKKKYGKYTLVKKEHLDKILN